MNQQTSTDTALTFIPLFSGTLSILGASAILYNVLSDPQRRFTTPYFRIMFGLGVVNILYAIAKMFSTFAAPQGTPGLYYASGNQATCNVQGFVVHLGLSQALYTACLCINYLLVIKYSKSDAYLSKYLEPYMHILSVGYPLIGACICSILGNFNSSPIGCWTGSFPMDCDINDKNPCTRGQKSRAFLWVFSGSVLSISFIIVAFCMLATVLHVRKRMRVMNHRFNFGQSRISRSRNLDKQYRLVWKQAILYVGTFIVVWIFEYVFRFSRQINRTSNSDLLIPTQILNPMQGFFNLIIYLWPRYMKAREENKERSFWWLIQDCIITTTRSKAERRRSNDVSRRIVKKRMSILRRSRLREEIHIEPTIERSVCVELEDQTNVDVEEVYPVLVSDENVSYADHGTMLHPSQRIESTVDEGDDTIQMCEISSEDSSEYGLTAAELSMERQMSVYNSIFK